MELADKIKLLPDQPGVYLFKDSRGELLYVGKAVSLKNRVRSYFQASRNQPPKVTKMVDQIDDLEYILTDSEIEALILESNLIKKHHPPFNIQLRDDKHYPYIRVSIQEQWPRVSISRAMKKDGARYFGPYFPASAMHETLQLVRRIFPHRSCTDQVMNNVSRPCLNYHIKLCPGPCHGRVSEEEYRKIINDLVLFLEGRSEKVMKNLEKEMLQAAEELAFERAAQLRDRLEAVRTVSQKQKVISETMADQDIIGMAQTEQEAVVQLFFVREGKLIGRSFHRLSNIDGLPSAEIVAAFIKQYYQGADFIPPEIIIPHPVEEKEVLEAWLSSLREKKVKLVIPHRGDKKRLVEMVMKNALQSMQEMEAARSSDLQPEEALRRVQSVLGLEGVPQRIEGYDISNIQGSQAVGSLVVFEGGRPKKEGYRRFKIKLTQGPNDFAMLQEVIRRRFSHLSLPAPDLLLIDGGKGQLNAVLGVLEELGFGYLPVIGLAKEEEEIFLADRTQPLVLGRDDPALYLLQRIRDEAHRFAVSYHRQLRDKKIRTSKLDEIPGVGPKRKRALLRAFGSIKRLKEAPVEELAKVPGMNSKVAARLKEYLSDIS